MKSKKPRDPAVPARLALRYIESNLCFTRHEAWAWFVLPTQPWAFRSDMQREQLLFGFGDALAWLAGHRVHLRVTSRPYPTAEWARRLHAMTPNPLDTEAVEPWTGGRWAASTASGPTSAKPQVSGRAACGGVLRACRDSNPKPSDP